MKARRKGRKGHSTVPRSKWNVIKRDFILPLVVGILLLNIDYSCFRNNEQWAATKQTIGSFENDTIASEGDNSPVTVNHQIFSFNGSVTIFQLLTPRDFPGAPFTNQVGHIPDDTNFEYREVTPSGLATTQIVEERASERHSGSRTTVPDPLTTIRPPLRAYDISARLASAYNSGNITGVFAIACEGTNVYERIAGAYDREVIMVGGSFLEIASACYSALAEHAMYSKDYSKALQLIQRAEDISPRTNSLHIAIHAALYQLNREDDRMSALLAYIIDHFDQDLRYEIVNTLTKMGYLLPYKLAQKSERDWEIQEYPLLGKNFGLSKELIFPIVFQAKSGAIATNPTIMRWVGLNQYEPLDLVKHFRLMIEQHAKD